MISNEKINYSDIFENIYYFVFHFTLMIFERQDICLCQNYLYSILYQNHLFIFNMTLDSSREFDTLFLAVLCCISGLHLCAT